MIHPYKHSWLASEIHWKIWRPFKYVCQQSPVLIDNISHKQVKTKPVQRNSMRSIFESFWKRNILKMWFPSVSSMSYFLPSQGVGVCRWVSWPFLDYKCQLSATYLLVITLISRWSSLISAKLSCPSFPAQELGPVLRAWIYKSVILDALRPNKAI